MFKRIFAYLGILVHSINFNRIKMAGKKRSSGSPGVFSRKGTAPASSSSTQKQMPAPTVSSTLPPKIPQTAAASPMSKPVTPTSSSVPAKPVAPTSSSSYSAPHPTHSSTVPPRAPGAPGAYPQGNYTFIMHNISCFVLFEYGDDPTLLFEK